MQNGTTVSESFRTIREKLIEELSAAPSPDEVYAAMRSLLISFRRNDDCVSALAPRDRRMFPILIDIAEAGVKAGLKSVRLKAVSVEAVQSADRTLGPRFCAALRLAALGLLAGVILTNARPTLDFILETGAVITLLLIEAAPHFSQMRVCVERALPGRERSRFGEGAQDAGGAARSASTDSAAAFAASIATSIAVDAPSFADQFSDVLVTVDKALRLIAHPAPPQPKPLLKDKDALALMQDLIAARLDGDGERALILLRQIEPLLLTHGVSVHPYCPELAGMFTIQKGPDGAATATVRPALAAGGRVVAFGVAEAPPPDGAACLQPET